MRVIAGTARGRKLVAPDGQGTRPITDRAKEGIFNMLGPIIEMPDVSVLDLYAGTGSFGIECLSRGAGHVTFVERNRSAAAVIERNLVLLGFEARASVMVGAVESVIRTARPVELAFCDPPYVDDVWADVLPRVPADVLVGHASFEIPLSLEWTEVRRRRYGRSRIVIAERAGGDEDGANGE